MVNELEKVLFYSLEKMRLKELFMKCKARKSEKDGLSFSNIPFIPTINFSTIETTLNHRMIVEKWLLINFNKTTPFPLM